MTSDFLCEKKNVLTWSVFPSCLLACSSCYIFPRKPSRHDAESNPRQWPGRKTTVLLLSNAESGLSNVLLATSHALLVEYCDLNVHFSSFPKREKDISRISNALVIFQQMLIQSCSTLCPARHMKKPLILKVIVSTDLSTALGLAGLAKLCRHMQDYLMPWSAHDYLALYRQVLHLIEEIDPAVFAVDPLFGPGLDAIQTLSRRQVIISPNSLKENFAQLQPWASIL
jgi:hypothetical protein